MLIEVAYTVCALLGTAVAVLLIKKPAEYIGLLDRPGGRKQHETAVPLTGGVAMVLSFLLLVPALDLLPSFRYIGLLAGTLALAVAGFMDDFRELSVRNRFIIQCAVVVLCMNLWGQTQIINLGDLLGLGDVPLGALAIPFSIFCVVCVINAFNFIDGLDGLAGGLAVIGLGCFGVIASTGGRLGPWHLVIVLVGGLIGFLLFNMRTPWRARACVFMGDCGSMFLGFVLCWFAIDLSQGEGRVMAPITAVWILGLPIMDTVNVVFNRLLRGHGPFTPSRDHLHHVLLMLGFSAGQTACMLLVAGALISGVGLGGHWLGLRESVMFYAFVGLYAVYSFAIRQFWRQPYARLIDRVRETSEADLAFESLMAESSPDVTEKVKSEAPLLDDRTLSPVATDQVARQEAIAALPNNSQEEGRDIRQLLANASVAAAPKKYTTVEKQCRL